MTYQQTEKYLNSFINYETKSDFSYQDSFKLERIREFLDRIGNPQEKLKCIHIAGSKGKGSTCAFVAYILKEAGFKTGLYTSPHLSDFRERIRILTPNFELLTPNSKNDFEGMISEELITTLVERLKPQIDKFNKTSECGQLSFFEVYTAIAFEHFKNEKVDFVVLETGMGGRLDATNVVNALISCIAPISLEHTQRLGRTIAKIAAEKSGIIKNNNQIVVTSAEASEALKVIIARCRKFKAKLFVLNKDFSFKAVSSDLNGQRFNLSGIFEKYQNLNIKLLGKHQLTNAATAVACVELLRMNNINIPKQAIKQGLEDTRWPARLEKIRENPKVFLDAAHNPASAKALRESFKSLFNSHKPILVLGISSDKDIKGVINQLKDLSKDIILTKADNPRAAEPADLKKFFGKNKNIAITQNTKQAINLAMKKAKQNDTILVTGSFFVAGEIRKLCLN
jgi:dihydrofolate synthase/folylpolyglutamate synthase